MTRAGRQTLTTASSLALSRLLIWVLSARETPSLLFRDGAVEETTPVSGRRFSKYAVAHSSVRRHDACPRRSRQRQRLQAAPYLVMWDRKGRHCRSIRTLSVLSSVSSSTVAKIRVVYRCADRSLLRAFSSNSITIVALEKHEMQKSIICSGYKQVLCLLRLLKRQCLLACVKP